jgi:hypothetical protein
MVVFTTLKNACQYRPISRKLGKGNMKSHNSLSRRKKKPEGISGFKENM